MSISLRRRALAGAAVSVLALAGQSAYAANVTSSQLTVGAPSSIGGGFCTLPVSFSVRGTNVDATPSGQQIDYYRVHLHPTLGNNSSLGNPQIGNVQVGVTAGASLSPSITASDITSAGLNGANGLYVGVFDTTASSTSAAPGPRLETEFVPASFFQNQGSDCNAVYTALTSPANQTPTADAGPDQNEPAFVGGQAFLDGTGSSDPQGDPLTYSWTQVSGPIASLNQANTATPSFTPPRNTGGPAPLVFELTVSDGTNTSMPDQVVFDYNYKPFARPGSNASPSLAFWTQLNNTWTLDGSGSDDADGETLTYQWTQTAGPTVTLTNATSATPSFTLAPAASPQDVTFQLIVNDGTVDSDPRSVIITVPSQMPTNQAPQADAGFGSRPSLGDYTAANNTFTLNGANSFDPDGDPLTFSWTQIAGPTVTLSDPTISNPTFTEAPGPQRQDVTFELTVSDGTLTSQPDQVTFRIPAAGAAGAPIASAGPDRRITRAQLQSQNNEIMLDGSGSTDPDGDPLTYSWRQNVGPTGTLSGANTAMPTFMPPSGITGTASYSLVLTVSDGTTSVEDSVVITVDGTSVPIADAGADQNPTAGTYASANNTFVLDGSGSTNSPNSNTSLVYIWRQVSGPAATQLGRTQGGSMLTYGFTPRATAQTLVFELIVDEIGSQSAPDTVTVVIPAAGPNQAPVADAGADIAPSYATYRNDNFTITLDGTGSSDPDGDPITYSWTKVAGGQVSLANANTATPSFSIPATNSTQSYTFELTVDDGSVTSTDQVNVTIPAFVNSAPTADAGPDQAPNIADFTTANNTITLDGTGSMDVDGDPLTYNWTQAGGPTVTLSSQTAAQPTFTIVPTSQPQVLDFRLFVNDGTANSQNDFVQITIPAQAVSGAPIADAGRDITDANYQSGTNIQLDATNSSDPDGDPLTYSWRQIAGPQAFLGNGSTATPTVSLNTVGLSGQQVLEFEVTVSDGTSTDTDTVSLFLTPAQGTNSALTVRRLRIANYLDTGTECQVKAFFTATGGTNDDGQNRDNFQARLTDGNDGNRLDNGQTGFVPVGDTRNIERFATLRTSTANNANGGGQLFYNVFDVVGDGSSAVIGQRVARVPIDLNAMAAAGGVCASAANRVRGTNAAPIADAGPDQSFQNVRTSQTVTLNGTGSSDADNDPITYRWTQIAGTPVTLSDPTVAQPTFSFLPTQAETLVFELVVNDGTVSSGGDRVEIAFAPFANSTPATNAGPDQTIVVPPNGQTVQLDGSATSDPDGDPLTYTWVQVSGPSVTLSDPAIVNPTFATPAVTADTALVFRLTADDGTDSATDEVTINLDINESPVADAGPAQQAALTPSGQTVQLDASGSTDPEGDTLTYTWTQISGATVNLNGVNTATPTFTVPSGVADGDTAVFEVEVSDGTTSSTAQVTVTYVANSAPVADAGADINVIVPPESRTITLTAAASSDADGDPLTYQWRQVSGPGAGVNLNGVNTATPSFTLPSGVASGTFVFEVEVSDGNATSTDQVQVVVVRNDAPTADAGADQAINVPPGGQTVTLDGSASSDPENDTLVYSWVQLDGPIVTLSDPNAVSPTFTVPAGVTDADDFRFQLTVTDGRNPDAVDEVFIDIIVDDPPIADAGADQSLDNPADGQTIVLDGSGSSDPEGQALTYSWTQVSGRTVTLTDANTVTPEFTFDKANAPARESFVFELTVSDGTNTSPVDSVTIDVVNNTAPVADAGADQTNVNADQTVTLDATGSSDPDGDALTYSWTQVSGPTVTLSDDNTATPTFTAPDVSVATDLVFEVTVDDGDLTDTDRVTVGIQPVGSITIVQLTQGGDVSVPFTSTLSQLSGPIQTVNGVGQRVATRVGQGTYTVQATDVRNLGFALTSLTCSDGDSTTDVTTGLATIALAPGEDVVCTFSSVNSRGAAQAEIGKYLGARNALLLSSGPDRQRRLDRLNGVAASGGATAYGIQLPGASYSPVRVAVSDGRAAFSTSLSAVNGIRRKTDAGRGMGTASVPGSYDVWIEGSLADVDIAGRDGGFGVVHGGADVRVGENVLLGAMLSLDSFEVDGDANGVGEADGDGYLVGPYVTARVADNLYVDARVAYGESDNSISALGTFTDEFETSRFFTDAAVFGEWDVSEKLNIRPLVGIRYLEEDQKEYVDSLGVTIPGQTVDVGELSFAPRFQTVMPVSANWTLRPYAEVEGILAFGDEIEDILGSETRLRTELGTDIVSLSGVRGGVSVFADGIGADDFGSQGVRVRVGWSFR